jgi:hypothetical protein
MSYVKSRWVASQLYNIFELQGNKLLEEATNLDACRSNFNFFGDQTIIYANMVVIVEKVVVVQLPAITSRLALGRTLEAMGRG